MTKHFIVPQNNDEDESLYFSGKISGSSVFLKTMDQSEDRNDIESVSIVLPSEHISFRNHIFPFNNKKRIEKVIDFELEPFFLSKNENYSVLFNQLKEKRKKNTPKAFCMGVSDTFLDKLQDQQLEKGIEVTGFAPWGYCQVSALIRLGFIKNDCVVIIKESNDTAIIFAVTPDQILSAKKVNLTSDIKDLVMSVRMLKNYVKISVKNEFKPVSIEIIDSFGSGSTIYDRLHEQHSSDNISFVDNSSLRGHLEIDSDLSLSYVLFAYELSFQDSLVYRRKKPGLKKFFDAYKSEIISSCMLLIIATGLTGFIFFNSLIELKNEHSRAQLMVRKSLNRNFPEIKRITGSPLDQAKIKLLNAKKMSKDSSKRESNIKKIKLLSIITSSVKSDGIELEKITVLPVSTSISGSTEGYELIDEFKKEISKNSEVNDVKISMATTDNSGKIRFRLELDLNE